MKTTMIVLVLLAAVMLLSPTNDVYAQTSSLGGLSVTNDLNTVLGKMKNPDAIRARRMDIPIADYAVLVYERGGMTIIGLDNSGEMLANMLTESASYTTNDGIKVGDTKENLVAKRGQPEETGEEVPGITEYWYWKQGINFGVNTERGTVENIFLFPPTTAEAQSDQEFLSLPTERVDLRHEYKGEQDKGFIIGRMSCKSDVAAEGVRLGITFFDEQGRAVDVAFSDVVKMTNGTSAPFKVSAPVKGKWASYQVDVQALQKVDKQKATALRTKRLLRSAR